MDAKTLRKKIRTEKIEIAVIWACQCCGTYNLDPLDGRYFTCVGCGQAYYAEAERKYHRELRTK